MPYPDNLRDSLAKVEASRAKRIQESHPRFSPEARQEVLRGFHPDYIGEAFRELRIGPNRGDRAPRELADALEAPSLLTEHPVVSPDHVCDILIIGGGGAGATPGPPAQENGAEGLLATKLRFGDANTMRAQG